MARPAGFEPTTPWFVAKYSNPTELRARCNCKKRIMLEMSINCKCFPEEILKKCWGDANFPSLVPTSVYYVAESQRDLLKLRNIKAINSKSSP